MSNPTASESNLASEQQPKEAVSIPISKSEEIQKILQSADTIRESLNNVGKDTQGIHFHFITIDKYSVDQRGSGDNFFGEIKSNRDVVIGDQTRKENKASDNTKSEESISQSAKKGDIDNNASQPNENLSEEIDEWFNRHTDFSLSSLMISLSVLNGCREDVFFDMSSKLQQYLARHFDLVAQTSAQENSANSSKEFLNKKSSLLKILNATFADGKEHTEYGISNVKLLQFSNSDYQDAVLSHVWNERWSWREPLLEWLLELGSHKSFQVRAKAADAVGNIICFDAFETIRSKVLMLWSKSPEPSTRRLVGRALSIPIIKDCHTNEVLTLLRHWITLKDDFNLRWTATVAHYSDICLFFPKETIKNINKAVQANDWLLFFALADTLLGMFEAGQIKEDLYMTVLKTLIEWANEKRTSMAYQLSQIVFWSIMHETKSSPEGETTHCPTPLWLFTKDEEYRKAFSTLLRQSLFGEKLHLDMIFSEVRNWLENSVKDEKLYRKVRYVIYTVLDEGSEPEAIRLLRYLIWWRDSFRMEIAGRILLELKPHLKQEYGKLLQN